jgi:hypothetical protein
MAADTSTTTTITKMKVLSIAMCLIFVGLMPHVVAESDGTGLVSANNPSSKIDSFDGLFRVQYDDNSGNKSTLMTDGKFCVIQVDLIYKWGYIKTLKPLSADFVGKGDLKQALIGYEAHCRTIYSGEPSVSVLRKIQLRNVREKTDSISHEMQTSPRFKFQIGKWYLIDSTELLYIQFIEYDGNLVVDSMYTVAYEDLPGKGVQSDKLRRVDRICLK